MKLLYKPIGIVLGLLAGFAASKIFNAIWAKFDNEEPPKPTTKQTTWVKVLGAAALQGVVMKTVRAAIDRQGARGWEYLTGSWPGEKQPGREGLGD